MKSAWIVSASLMLVPAWGYGLDVSIGVHWEDGSSIKLEGDPIEFWPIGLTTVLHTDENLSGFWYQLGVQRDPDWEGPALPEDAASLFQYVATVSLSGKGANPFTGASRLHGWASENGVFDETGFDQDLFGRGDYNPGFNFVPTPLSAAAPQVIFKSSEDAIGSRVDGRAITTFAIAPIEDLGVGVYTFFVTDYSGQGMEACSSHSGCVPLASAEIATLIVQDETPVEMVSARSRKIHLPSQGFEADVNVFNGGIEPRLGGVSTLILGFSRSVRGISAFDLDCDNLVLSRGTCASISGSGTDTITVELQDEPADGCLSVSIQDLRAVDGAEYGGAEPLIVHTIKGDRTLDGVVNISDLIEIKRSLFTLTPGNFLSDLNVDGVVNIADLHLAKGNLFARSGCP